MASVVSNAFKKDLLDGAIVLATDAAAKIMLLQAITTTPDNPDNATVDVISADEFSDTGYTGGFGGAGRVALSSKATAKDDTNDRATFDMADITWSSLGGTSSAVFAVIIREATNDAGSRIVSAHDIADTATNGTDFTLTVGTTGAIHLT